MAGQSEALLLDGLKVLEVATWIAAPVAATMLADLGADVIKVEQPVVGDPYRMWSNLPTGPQAGAWLTDARNRRSLSLNLKDAAAKDILLRLVSDADVYITNQPLAIRRRFGLTYEDLAPLNERLIYASVTGYGEFGPDADRESFDFVAYWTRSGLADYVRDPDGMPASPVPGMGDHPTAVSLYAAILTAIMRRERTGKGSYVHTNLMHNGLWSNACFASTAFMPGADLGSSKTAAPPIISRRFFRTADGRFLQLFMVRTEAEMDAMLIAAGATDLLTDARFASPEARLANVEDFATALRALFVQRNARDWMATFGEMNVPANLVAELGDLATDEQIHAASAVVPPADSSINADFIIAPPGTVNGMPRVGPLPAPVCGEHTDEILAELGLSPEEIAALRARAAV